jgi:WD40-like Beta Propeller Repeat
VLAVAALNALAQEPAMEAARLIGRQRIPSAGLDTLGPAAVSYDGRLIAFVAADGSVARGRCCRHVYLLDQATGVVTLESNDPDGMLLHADSLAPSLSADGEIIAFETLASVPRLTAAYSAPLHIVVRNRRDSTLRTPTGVNGAVPNGLTRQPALSANGRSVAFTSDATNLARGSEADSRGTNVFIWRLDDETVTRVSIGDDDPVTPSSRGASHTPAVSAEGDLVAFTSTARLVREDTNSVADVYVRDVRHARTILVSRAMDGRAGDAGSYSPALSSDGRYVAFASRAGNLVSHDRNKDADVFVRDVVTQTTLLVSATSNGSSANAASTRPSISADGRWVVYQSNASNLGSSRRCPRVGRDENLLPDVYSFDRLTGCVSRMSGSSVDEWWDPSVASAVAGSGNTVVFSSTRAATGADLGADFDLFAFTR